MNKHYTNENNPLENFSLDPEDRLVHATSKRQSLFKASKGSKQDSAAIQCSKALLEEGVSPVQGNMRIEQNVLSAEQFSSASYSQSMYQQQNTSDMQPVYQQQNTSDVHPVYQQQNNSDIQNVSGQFTYNPQSQSHQLYQSYQDYSQMQMPSKGQDLTKEAHAKSNSHTTPYGYSSKISYAGQVNGFGAEDYAGVQDEYYSSITDNSSITNNANSTVDYNNAQANRGGTFNSAATTTFGNASGQALGVGAENFGSSFNRTVDSSDPYVQSGANIDADDKRVGLNLQNNLSLTQGNVEYGNQASQSSVESSQLENNPAVASNTSKQIQKVDNQDAASNELKVESVDTPSSQDLQSQAPKSQDLQSQASKSQETNSQETQPQGNFLYQWREQRRAEKKAREEYKAAIKSGAIPKPSFFKRVGHAFASLFSLGWKMGIAGLCVCIGLFIYFDSVVISQYEVDDKWVLPAVVYSRPLELYPDQRLSLEQMLYELKLLKYREVSSPRRQGEYAVNKENGRIVLIKRQFQFPEGEEPAMSVMVKFDDKRVSRILNAETKQDLSFMRMDPVLLDRINRINPQEDRIFITLEEVPKELITTLIEIEDRSYYSHIGVNPMAIGRAFVKNFMAGGVVEGGSTITQQLVKNYFLTNERSYSRKLKEIFMAISMNHRYNKDQILEAYMNEIYLGQNGNAGIYGFGLASYFYFGVPVAELSLDQMALLVGLIKGPSYYDPWRHPEKALERRNTVLAVLRNRGHISSERFESESQKPLNVIARGQLNYSKTPAFMGLVKTEIGYRFKEEEERTGKDFLSGNGIRIFTSLDPQAQVAAEKAVQTEIAAIEKERKLKGLESAMIVSSWRTGEVSAVVGSSNPKFDGYNRVLDSRRQVGSLIKPFVYLTAFHQGYHLGSIVSDSPVKVKLPNGDVWAPKNDDKRFRGPIRVIRAMASSLNVPTVRVGMGSGLDNVINTLHAAGFKRKLDMYPSIVLGTPEISPYELNSMYVGMATEGIYRDLTTLRTIVKNGEIVYQRGSNRVERTLDPKDTYLALYGMTEATRSGTGRKIHAAFPDVTIASKTGTTNDFRDSWTVGMDSDELSTIWVGFDNNKSTGLYGATGAMRLYIAYLKERGVNSLVLKKPDGIAFVNFDKQGNVLASGCEEPGMETFPAREDRIQFIKQCNNFGESGYEELPYDVPNRPAVPEQNQQNAWPNMQPSLNNQPAWNAQPYPSVPNSSNMQMNNQGNAGMQNTAGQAAYPLTPMPQGALVPPNQDALQSSSVEDSKAKDVQPVTPDMNARPTQSSSSNIERQADSFEDQLLGL